MSAFGGKAEIRWKALRCLLIAYDPDVRLRRSSAVLGVADVFQPVDDLAVKRFGNRNVCHRSGRCRPVPMLLARREPDDVPRPDLLDRPALALRKAAAGRDNQCLPQ